MKTYLSKILNNSLKQVAAIFILLFFLFSTGSGSALAQMSSGTYRIPTDSINIGGQQSGSTTYKELDTIGEQGSGLSNSATYNLSAGFLASENVYLALTAAADITMSPAISGLTGGTGTGSTSWTATTDNPAGYTMTINATTNPAMQSGANSFANYTPATSDPDYSWSIASTDSEFGFTPEGTDVYSRFKDNGSSACNTGVLDTVDKCWDSLTTSTKTIAQRASGNHPSGTLTTVKVQAESGTSHIQPNGNYSATIQITLLSL